MPPTIYVYKVGRPDANDQFAVKVGVFTGSIGDRFRSQLSALKALGVDAAIIDEINKRTNNEYLHLLPFDEDDQQPKESKESYVRSKLSVGGINVRDYFPNSAEFKKSTSLEEAMEIVLGFGGFKTEIVLTDNDRFTRLQICENYVQFRDEFPDV